MKRRIQTFAVLVQEFTQTGTTASIIILILLKLIGVKKVLGLLAAYYAHVAVSGVEFKQGRKMTFFRKLPIWKHFAG